MTDQPKNVIYLIADSLRPDTLGCYGNQSNVTTQIDDLAEEGILFEDAVSAAPWTIPSVKSHVTGKYPHDIGLFDPNENEGTNVFNYFSDHGYETALFYDSERRTELFPDDIDTYGWSYDIETMLNFITDNSDESFFIFNLYRGTHLPYTLKYSAAAWTKAKDEMMAKIQSGSEDELAEVKTRYARSVERFSEWYVGALVDRLREEGVLEDTAIVITGDHGESWGDRFEDQSEVDLFDLHGTLLYEEVLSVPLILYNFGLGSGDRIEQMVRSVDILPTLSESLGLPPMREDLDGSSLMSSIPGTSDDFPEMAFTSTTTHDQFGGIGSNNTEATSTFTKFAVRRRDGWKFILNADTGVRELYNLNEDPDERQNLVDDATEAADELEGALQAEFDDDISGDGTPDEVRSRLEDLGYL